MSCGWQKTDNTQKFVNPLGLHACCSYWSNSGVNATVYRHLPQDINSCELVAVRRSVNDAAGWAPGVQFQGNESARCKRLVPSLGHCLCAQVRCSCSFCILSLSPPCCMMSAFPCSLLIIHLRLMHDGELTCCTSSVFSCFKAPFSWRSAQCMCLSGPQLHMKPSSGS